MSRVKIICAGSHLDLGNDLVDWSGLSKVEYVPGEFANTETRVQLKDNVRGHTVVIVATGAPSVNDSLMEACLLADTCRRSGTKEIILIMAYYPYSRQDKKDTPRTPISGKLVTDMIELSGVNRLVTLDLHSGQTQGFTNMPFDNLYARSTFTKYFHDTIFKGLTLKEMQDKYVLISPDNGGANRIKAYAAQLKLGYAIMDKNCDYTQPNVVHKSSLVSSTDCTNKIGLVIDDMMDTMGTMVSAAESLKENGIKSAIVVVTHGILSGPAIDRMNSCDFITKVIVTNTLDQTEKMKKCSKLEVVSVTKLLGQAVTRILNGDSLSELFQ